MAHGIQWIVERLAERFVPLIGGLFSSTIETFHALGLAEQQSHLEEAARRYEAEGKHDIATALRARADQLTSNDPAAQAVRMAENLAVKSLLPRSGSEPVSPDLPHLPGPRQPKGKSAKKKGQPTQDTQIRPALPPINPNKPA